MKSCIQISLGFKIKFRQTIQGRVTLCFSFLKSSVWCFQGILMFGFSFLTNWMF